MHAGVQTAERHLETGIREEVERGVERVLDGSGLITVEVRGMPFWHFSDMEEAMRHARDLAAAGHRDVQVVDRRGPIGLLVVISD